VLELNSGEEQCCAGSGWRWLVVPVLLTARFGRPASARALFFRRPAEIWLAVGGRQPGIKLDSPAPEPWTDHESYLSAFVSE